MSDYTSAEPVIEQILSGDRLLSVLQAAAVLGVSPWTIRMWCSQKKLKRTKIGSRTMIRASELKRVIKDE